MLGVLLILTFGCADDGGGSDGAPAPAAVIETLPVDLAPGQTSAVLEWEPSLGPVSSYYVLESRNESDFEFRYFRNEPNVEITGQPGDNVQLQVIAISDNGTFSATSPPSVPIRFHPAESASSAATAVTAASTSSASITSLTVPLPAAGPVVDADAGSQTTRTTDASGDGVPPVDQAIRERLLGANVRFPISIRSAEANQWLSARIDPEIAAGLSLVGTGDTNGDDFRELIWVDPAGQLFVSDGARSIASADPSNLFSEGPRLGATERFVGLADFRGDGLGDWLIEDTATQMIWLIDGQTQTATALGQGDSYDPPDDPATTAGRLVGHGDFDGNGQSELVWQNEDGSLRVTSGNGHAVALTWTPATELEFDPEASELLIIADLDGDGRDDLLFRDTEDRLLSATLVDGRVDGNGGPLFSPMLWSARSSEGLELIAALDFDSDGTAELAWYDGIDVALWSASDTF